MRAPAALQPLRHSLLWRSSQRSEARTVAEQGGEREVADSGGDGDAGLAALHSLQPVRPLAEQALLAEEGQHDGPAPGGEERVDVDHGLAEKVVCSPGPRAVCVGPEEARRVSEGRREGREESTPSSTSPFFPQS